ncbi:MAG: S41 family peptidase [Eubacterium sp.]|nr:S41 family peptidase [Eubacterium sp.]
MKKNNYSRLGRTVIAGVLMLSMTMTAMPAGQTAVSSAAKTTKSKITLVASAKGKILTGESRTLTIKNIKKKSIKKLTVTSTKKAVATVKKSGKTKVIIRSKKAGKTTVRIKLLLKNKKKRNLKYVATVADTVDRKVPLTKNGGTESTMTLRFFAKTPHVPYVRMKDYYVQLSGGKPLQVQKNSADEYLITTPKGETATINTKSDTLESDAYSDFTRVYPPEEGDVPINTDYGGAPFLEPLADVVLEEDAHYSLSYADYGLDLIGDTDDIWLPFGTASNSFMTGYGASIAYSGKKLYHYTDLSDLDEFNTNGYFDEYMANFPNGVRPKDLADYTYRELMFIFDVQYGIPGRCYFSDAIREKGMDRALLETDDQTRAVRDLLRSTDMKDYLIGLGLLHDMVFDGGHTMLDYYIDNPYKKVTGLESNVTAAYDAAVREAADKIGYTLVNTPDPYWDVYVNIKDTKKDWKGFDYHEQGDTAVYSMGQMVVDSDAWKKYYAEGGELPEDTYGYFIKYLNKASENPAIKNFVIDLTTNTGGDTNVLSGMNAIITDDPCTYFTITETGKKIKCPYNVDTNVDGKFDEKDKEVKYPFRFAFVTSRCSFSCGNMLPCVANSYGLMVLGETSGGGDCAIISMVLGDGLPITISSIAKFTTKDGAGLDQGAKLDKVLEIKKKEDGTDDYSAFFDIDALSSYINEFYKAA